MVESKPHFLVFRVLRRFVLYNILFPDVVLYTSIHPERSTEHLQCIISIANIDQRYVLRTKGVSYLFLTLMYHCHSIFAFRLLDFQHPLPISYQNSKQVRQVLPKFYVIAPDHCHLHSLLQALLHDHHGAQTQ
jgi:hypothetical protein